MEFGNDEVWATQSLMSFSKIVDAVSDNKVIKGGKTGNQPAGVKNVIETEIADEDSKDMGGDQNSVSEDAPETGTTEQSDADKGKEGDICVVGV